MGVARRRGAASVGLARYCLSRAGPAAVGLSWLEPGLAYLAYPIIRANLGSGQMNLYTNVMAQEYCVLALRSLA